MLLTFTCHQFLIHCRSGQVPFGAEKVMFLRGTIVTHHKKTFFTLFKNTVENFTIITDCTRTCLHLISTTNKRTEYFYCYCIYSVFERTSARMDE